MTVRRIVRRIIVSLTIVAPIFTMATLLSAKAPSGVSSAFFRGPQVTTVTADTAASSTLIPVGFTSRAEANEALLPAGLVMFGDDLTIYEYVTFYSSSRSLRIRPGLVQPAPAGTAVYPATCLDFADPPSVGLEDLQSGAAHWHQKSGDPDWDGSFDLDRNGIVTVADIMPVATAWGGVCQSGITMPTSTPTNTPTMCYHNHIVIHPTVPTTSDVVKITPAGVWCDTCVPEYQFHQTIGNIIRIYAAANPPGFGCFHALAPWAFSIEVGLLQAGTYTVEVYISRWGGLPTLNDSESFTVVTRVYLPIILK